MIAIINEINLKRNNNIIELKLFIFSAILRVYVYILWGDHNSNIEDKGYIINYKRFSLEFTTKSSVIIYVNNIIKKNKM